MTGFLERVATAIRLALHEDYSHLSERDMSRAIARKALEATRQALVDEAESSNFAEDRHAFLCAVESIDEALK